MDLFLGLLIGTLIGVSAGYRWGRDVGVDDGAAAWRGYVIWQLREAAAAGRLDEARIRQIFEIEES